MGRSGGIAFRRIGTWLLVHLIEVLTIILLAASTFYYVNVSAMLSTSSDSQVVMTEDQERAP